jgi:hypothetical protein
MHCDSPLLKPRLIGMLALCALWAALLLALCSSSVRAAVCVNEAVRAEQGPAALALPECRAYERVSPGSTPAVAANNLAVNGGKASLGGGAIAYFSRYPAEGAQNSSEVWLSKRTAAGWTITFVQPQATPAPTQNAICAPGTAFSEFLDVSLLAAGGDLESIEEVHNGECGGPEEELVPGEPRGFANLYLRHGTDPYVLVNSPPAEVTPANATYQAASPDLSHIVFSESATLAPGSTSKSNLFEWSEGTIREIGILPNGEHVAAKLAAPTAVWGAISPDPQKGLGQVAHAVSVDGERVFFSANGGLYLRENAGQPPAANGNCATTSELAQACTLRLDVSKGGVDGPGGGIFQFASRDGGRVFFTSDHRLLPTSSAESGKPALYEYQIESRKLIDLTVNAAKEVADVRGFSGGSDDGSHLYFVARGVLTGVQENGQGEAAQAGEPNLYLVEEGQLTFVATFAGEPGVDVGGWWEAGTNQLKTSWSPSGRYLLFSSSKALTGFDNSAAETDICGFKNPPCKELFLYDAEAEELKCVSCGAEGVKPIANTMVQGGAELAEFNRFGFGPRYLPRAVLDSGQVFFQTKNPLSPQDVNGTDDVYSYLGGNHSLISTGTGASGSVFLDTGADGRDVFFASPKALVRSDVDGGRATVYDARIDGGFAEPPLPPPPCAGEQCRPQGPVPPQAGSPATAAFAGSGNVKAKPCKHGKIRRGGKCVKKKHRHHRHHRAGNHRGNR